MHVPFRGVRRHVRGEAVESIFFGPFDSVLPHVRDGMLAAMGVNGRIARKPCRLDHRKLFQPEYPIGSFFVPVKSHATRGQIAQRDAKALQTRRCDALRVSASIR